MMKFNEFDTAMLFRYNLSMHLLLIYLLGGKFQEKGISVFNDIEAIIAPSIMDME